MAPGPWRPCGCRNPALAPYGGGCVKTRRDEPDLGLLWGRPLRRGSGGWALVEPGPSLSLAAHEEDSHQRPCRPPTNAAYTKAITSVPPATS